MSKEERRVHLVLYAKWTEEQEHSVKNALAALWDHLVNTFQDVSVWREDAFIKRLRNSTRVDSTAIAEAALLMREKDSVNQ